MATADTYIQQSHSRQCSCGFELLFIKHAYPARIPRKVIWNDAERFASDLRFLIKIGDVFVGSCDELHEI